MKSLFLNLSIILASLVISSCVNNLEVQYKTTEVKQTGDDGEQKTPPVVSPMSLEILEDIESELIKIEYSKSYGLSKSCEVTDLNHLVVTKECACDSGECGFKIKGEKNFYGEGGLKFTLTFVDTSYTEEAKVVIKPQNDPPQILIIDEDSTDEDVSKTLSFRIHDPDETPLECSLVNVTADKPEMFSILMVGGSAPDCLLNITPKDEVSESSVLKLTLSDGVETTTKNLTFNVLNINDPPVVSDIDPQSTDEDTKVVVEYNILDPDSPISCTTSVEVLYDPMKISSVVKKQEGDKCSLEINPELNAFGEGEIVLKVSDEKSITEKKFTLTIKEVNDPPILLGVKDLITEEDKNSISTFKITDPDSSLDCFGSVKIEGLDPNLISSYLIMGPTKECELKITPKENAAGKLSLKMVVSDQYSFSEKNFNFEILEVDDPPDLWIPTLALNFLEDEGPKEVAINLTDPDDKELNCQMIKGAPSFLFTVSISGEVPHCVAVVTPLKNESGMDSLLLSIENSQRDSQSIPVTVVSQPDPPSLTFKPEVLDLFEDEGTREIIGTIKDPDENLTLPCVDYLKASPSEKVSIRISGNPPDCRVQVSTLQNKNGTEIVIFNFLQDPTASQKLQINISEKDDPSYIELTETSLELKENQLPLPLLFRVLDPDEELPLLCSEAMVESSSDLMTLSPVVSDGLYCQLFLTPLENKNGKGVITFKVKGDEASTKTLNFEIKSLDEPAVIQIKTPSLSFKEDDPAKLVTFSLVDNDTEVDCKSVVISDTLPTSLVEWGQIQNSGSDCVVSVKPLLNLNGKGNLLFTYPTAESVTLSYDILPEDDAPIAQTPLLTIMEDVETVVEVKYLDMEKDKATACNVTGTLNLITNQCQCNDGVCTVKIKGNPDHFGNGNFKYTVTSNNKTSPVATALVSITNTPDAPVLTPNPSSLTFDKNSSAQKLLISVKDVDKKYNSCQDVLRSVLDPTLITVSTLQGTFPSCEVTVAPVAQKSGTTVINFSLGETQKSVTVTVNNISEVLSHGPHLIGFVNEKLSFNINYNSSSGTQATDCSLNLTTPSLSTGHLRSPACKCVGGLCTGEMWVDKLTSDEVSFMSDLVITVNVILDGKTINGKQPIRLFRKNYIPPIKEIMTDAYLHTPNHVSLINIWAQKPLLSDQETQTFTIHSDSSCSSLPLEKLINDYDSERDFGKSDAYHEAKIQLPPQGTNNLFIKYEATTYSGSPGLSSNLITSKGSVCSEVGLKYDTLSGLGENLPAPVALEVVEDLPPGPATGYKRLLKFKISGLLQEGDIPALYLVGGPSDASDCGVFGTRVTPTSVVNGNPQGEAFVSLSLTSGGSLWFTANIHRSGNSSSCLKEPLLID
jgi:hypothetical protein